MTTQPPVGQQVYTPTPQELQALTGINPAADPAITQLMQQMNAAGATQPADAFGQPPATAAAAPMAPQDLASFAPPEAPVAPPSQGGKALLGLGVAGAAYAGISLLTHRNIGKAYEKLAEDAAKTIKKPSGWNPLNWVRQGGAVEKALEKAGKTAAESTPAAVSHFASSAEVDSVIRHKDALKDAIGKLTADSSDNGAALDTLAARAGGSLGGQPTPLARYIDAVRVSHTLSNATVITDQTQKDAAKAITKSLTEALDKPAEFEAAYDKAIVQLGALHTIHPTAITALPAAVADHTSVQLLQELHAQLPGQMASRLPVIARDGGNITQIATDAIREHLGTLATQTAPDLTHLQTLVTHASTNSIPNIRNLRTYVTAVAGTTDDDARQGLTQVLHQALTSGDVAQLTRAGDFITLHSLHGDLTNAFGATGGTFNTALQTAYNQAPADSIVRKTVDKLNSLASNRASSAPTSDAAQQAERDINAILSAIDTRYLTPGTNLGAAPGQVPLSQLVGF